MDLPESEPSKLDTRAHYVTRLALEYSHSRRVVGTTSTGRRSQTCEETVDEREVW